MFELLLLPIGVFFQPKSLGTLCKELGTLDETCLKVWEELCLVKKALFFLSTTFLSLELVFAPAS